MDDHHRPDPDALLAAVQREEARQKRGKLKIFFGMAAGVGKTYAMLESARTALEDGIDVVVGYVETHGRAETEALLDGLEIIPRRSIEYRGAVLQEMDLDAVLERAPDLVLVDELAHTNVPGTRHPKRHQDIEELLDAGINVWTTVNVQHIESRTDTVHEITGITVHETVPDSILDQADSIELIDLAPEELRKRLSEGKVYTPERADIAAKNFFRIGNLTALREMALRLTAERVDHQLQDYMQIKQIAGPWKSGERLMVAVSASPLSERLIRWTRRMAYNLEAPWLAVYVEPPRPQQPAQKERLAANLALARQLGGEVISTTGDNIVQALVRVARQRNVTQIIVGKPTHTFWQDILRGGSVVNRLVRNSGDIDVYVVTGDETEHSTGREVFQPQRHSSWSGYVLALLIIGVGTLINLIIEPFIGYQAVGLTDLLMVLLIAAFIGRGPALVAAFVSAVSWDYLFIQPRYTFAMSSVSDVILIVVYFAIALFTGNLAARLRDQATQARAHADRTMALYKLAHDIATAVNMSDVLHTAVTQVSQIFNAEVAIFLRDPTGKLSLEAHPSSTMGVDAKESSVALWAFDNEKPAGRFTNTLPLASAQYLPLVTPGGAVGVMAVRLRKDERLSADEDALLETFANQIALVIEREMLDEAAEQTAMVLESERLSTVLLNSISHELRTPITAITGASGGLLDPQIAADETARRQLVQEIQDAGDRLNRLVENLLDMSRLESGLLRLKRDWWDVGELIGAVYNRMEERLAQHPVKIEVERGLPMVKIDFALMEQVLINVLENAVAYTPVGTPLSIEAMADMDDQDAAHDHHVRIIISDQGPGLPHDANRVFDKFYRAPGVSVGGTGLGLSIARGLVEAHGGQIRADNRPSGGARFTIMLPIDAE